MDSPPGEISVRRTIIGVDKGFVYMFTGWLQLCFPFIYIRTGCI